MNDDMALREAADDDAGELARLFRTCRRALLPTYDDPHTPAEDLRFLEGVIAGSEVWVAETPEQIAGFIAFTPVTIDHLYVLEAYRGDGVGTALLGWALRDGGARELWALASNTRAIAFYESHGFAIVERTDGSRNEERLPDVRMRREAEA